MTREPRIARRVALAAGALSVSALGSAAAGGCGLFPGLDGLSGADAASDGSEASDARTDGGFDAGIDAALPCLGRAGPRAVRVDGTMCIDATEVTRNDYAQFLANPKAGSFALPPACPTNLDMTPAAWKDNETPANVPVVAVSWCQAYAYCQWAGKRMCGHVDGGASLFDDTADAATSQWFRACSAGGDRAYPYGGTFDPSACNTGVKNAGPQAVGTHPRCVSASGAFDLSGNVLEWEDACNVDVADSACQLRGGNWATDSVGGACAFHEIPQPRAAQGFDIGIRCCSP